MIAVAIDVVPAKRKSKFVAAIFLVNGGMFLQQATEPSAKVARQYVQMLR